MLLKEKAVALSDELLRLDAGDLAELRPVPAGREAGPLAYWRLAATCGFLDDPPERWGPLVPHSGDPDAKGRETGAGPTARPQAVPRRCFVRRRRSVVARRS